MTTRVLLVEDNEASRDMLSRRLARRGFEVVLAVDGAAAIELCGTLRPDIVLLDLSLPVVDGWTAARVLKADPATAAIPLVALTAHAMAGDRERALAAGCDAYAAKPVELGALLETMASLLARR